MLQFIRNKLLGTTKKHIRRNKARTSRQLRIEGLEVRQMMTAGLTTSLSKEPISTAAMIPAAPSLTATDVSGTQINLAWIKVPGAIGYRVEELIPPETGPTGIHSMCVLGKPIASVGSGSTGYSVTGLSAGTTYTFEVAACTPASMYWSNPESATTIKATPNINWPTPAAITYGTALSGTQLDATASVPGTFSYTPAAGTVLPVGAGQKLSVTFTPKDTAYYTTVTQTTTINVNQVPSPSPGPFDIVYNSPSAGWVTALDEATKRTAVLYVGTSIPSVGIWASCTRVGNDLLIYNYRTYAEPFGPDLCQGSVIDLDLPTMRRYSFQVSWTSEGVVGNYLEFDDLTYSSTTRSGWIYKWNLVTETMSSSYYEG